MSISMIPNRFDESPFALHAINKCFLRAGSKAYPLLKRHLKSDVRHFGYIGDLLVQEDRFLRNCADYKLFCTYAPDPWTRQGPFIFIIDAKALTWHHVDERLESYLGYDLEELENDWVIAYHPDAYEETDEHFTRILRSLHEGLCNYAELDIRYQTKTGYSVWAQQTMSLVRDWKGNPEYILTVIRDVSMHKWTQLLYNELLVLQELIDTCRFTDRSARWIDGLLRHYNGEQVEGSVMHQIQVLVQDIV